MKPEIVAAFGAVLLCLVLVLAATILLLNDVDGAARAILYAASAAAFGSAGYTALRKR